MTKKGASLIWAMVMSTALLFIATTTASLVIKESQMSIRMDDSSRAYAAAESGIEWGKYCLGSLAQCNITSIPVNSSHIFPQFNVGGSHYIVTVSRTLIKTKVESVGTFADVNRKLEHIITNNNPLHQTTDPELEQALQIDGSYVQQFDYWATGTGFANIGFWNNSVSKQGIYFEHSGTNLYLVAQNDSKIPNIVRSQPLNIASIGAAAIADPYAFRVRIEYFKDLSAKMTVSKSNFSPGLPSLSCLGAPLVLDLRNMGLSSTSFSKFYFTGIRSAVVLPSSVGTVQKLTNGASGEAYFDNMATRGIANSISNRTLTYTAGVNGTISGISPQTVAVGGNGTAVTAVANSGYQFSSWSDGSTQNPRQDMSVTLNISVTPTFILNPTGNWIAGQAETGYPTALVGKYIYNVDAVGVWKDSDTSCVAPQCSTTIAPAPDPYAPSNMVLVDPIANSGVVFGATYPAQEACKALGGRLPTMNELLAIYAGKVAGRYGTFQTNFYWSATESSSGNAYYVNFNTGNIFSFNKYSNNWARCVR